MLREETTEVADLSNERERVRVLSLLVGLVLRFLVVEGCVAYDQMGERAMGGRQGRKDVVVGKAQEAKVGERN